MLQYLIIQLCDTSTSFCHYNSDRNIPNLISLDNLKAGITFAMKHNLMIQFLYPDYKLPNEYLEAIHSIDHNDIVSSTCEDDLLKENADIIVISDWSAMDLYDFKKDSIYAIRTTKQDFFDRYRFLKRVIHNVYRLNIIFTDVENFTDQDTEKYKTILNALSAEVANVFNYQSQVQVNVLTDRIVLSQMNNCNAGYTHLTLAPDGNLYVCPAFYTGAKIESKPHPEYNYCLGKIRNNIDIPNSNLYKLEYSPLCRSCDAYHCKRCVWLSKKLTLEVNTPSHEQCVISHIERNASKSLLESIRHTNPSFETIEIPEIKYLDPFDVRKEW